MGKLGDFMPEGVKEKYKMNDRKDRPQSKFKRYKRTAKSRSKMWFITQTLLRSDPKMARADIKRAVKKKYGESVGESVIDEAIWIYKKKVEAQSQGLEKSKESYKKLSQTDKIELLKFIVSQEDIQCMLSSGGYSWASVQLPPTRLPRQTASTEKTSNRITSAESRSLCP